MIEVDLCTTIAGCRKTSVEPKADVVAQLASVGESHFEIYLRNFFLSIFVYPRLEIHHPDQLLPSHIGFNRSVLKEVWVCCTYNDV